MSKSAAPFHDAAFWASRLVSQMVSENPDLEGRLRAGMLEAGMAEKDADNVISHIYGLATADTDDEGWVTDPELRRKLEEEADAYAGCDDVVIDSRKPIERVEGGYWVQASVFVHGEAEAEAEGSEEETA